MFRLYHQSNTVRTQRSSAACAAQGLLESPQGVAYVLAEARRAITGCTVQACQGREQSGPLRLARRPARGGGERIRDLPQPSLQEENTPVPGCSAVPDADQQPDTSAPQECCPLPKAPWRAWEQQLADLITRMTQGDQRALEDFYDATSALVYGLALQIVQESSAAEDVTLEVYMQVREQAMRYDPSRGTPSAWLLTLTRSRAIDQRRRLSVQQQREYPLEQADS